ncbi:unnamed protein product [Vitrella brassicaformis CCMP3155]|uniref:Uncharacterized protein n=2 Tax=Vitrella brassicaformis TaxID=1169539 RepID=A0A0G4E9K2_VITBC|nr:unnamed protein product [Vitrella brassicaformis CCMP3155]|eukprot:CEL92082.1 unnamed protein product [Vitrella brassicaformis CCMP3155]
MIASVASVDVGPSLFQGIVVKGLVSVTGDTGDASPSGVRGPAGPKLALSRRHGRLYCLSQSGLCAYKVGDMLAGLDLEQEVPEPAAIQQYREAAVFPLAGDAEGQKAAQIRLSNDESMCACQIGHEIIVFDVCQSPPAQVTEYSFGGLIIDFQWTARDEIVGICVDDMVSPAPPAAAAQPEDRIMPASLHVYARSTARIVGPFTATMTAEPPCMQIPIHGATCVACQLRTSVASVPSADVLVFGLSQPGHIGVCRSTSLTDVQITPIADNDLSGGIVVGMHSVPYPSSGGRTDELWAAVWLGPAPGADPTDDSAPLDTYIIMFRVMAGDGSIQWVGRSDVNEVYVDSWSLTDRAIFHFMPQCGLLLVSTSKGDQGLTLSRDQQFAMPPDGQQDTDVAPSEWVITRSGQGPVLSVNVGTDDQAGWSGACAYFGYEGSYTRGPVTVDRPPILLLSSTAGNLTAKILNYQNMPQLCSDTWEAPLPPSPSCITSGPPSMSASAPGGSPLRQPPESPEESGTELADSREGSPAGPLQANLQAPVPFAAPPPMSGGAVMAPPTQRSNGGLSTASPLSPLSPPPPQPAAPFPPLFTITAAAAPAAAGAGAFPLRPRQSAGADQQQQGGMFQTPPSRAAPSLPPPSVYPFPSPLPIQSPSPDASETTPEADRGQEGLGYGYLYAPEEPMEADETLLEEEEGEEVRAVEWMVEQEQDQDQDRVREGRERTMRLMDEAEELFQAKAERSMGRGIATKMTAEVFYQCRGFERRVRQIEDEQVVLSQAQAQQVKDMLEQIKLRQEEHDAARLALSEAERELPADGDGSSTSVPLCRRFEQMAEYEKMARIIQHLYRACVSPPVHAEAEAATWLSNDTVKLASPEVHELVHQALDISARAKRVNRDIRDTIRHASQRGPSPPRPPDSHKRTAPLTAERGPRTKRPETGADRFGIGGWSTLLNQPREDREGVEGARTALERMHLAQRASAHRDRLSRLPGRGRGGSQLVSRHPFSTPPAHDRPTSPPPAPRRPDFRHSRTPELDEEHLKQDVESIRHEYDKTEKFLATLEERVRLLRLQGGPSRRRHSTDRAGPASRREGQPPDQRPPRHVPAAHRAEIARRVEQIWATRPTQATPIKAEPVIAPARAAVGGPAVESALSYMRREQRDREAQQQIPQTAPHLAVPALPGVGVPSRASRGPPSGVRTPVPQMPPGRGPPPPKATTRPRRPDTDEQVTAAQRPPSTGRVVPSVPSMGGSGPPTDVDADGFRMPDPIQLPKAAGTRRASLPPDLSRIETPVTTAQQQQQRPTAFSKQPPSLLSPPAPSPTPPRPREQRASIPAEAAPQETPPTFGRGGGGAAAAVPPAPLPPPPIPQPPVVAEGTVRGRDQGAATEDSDEGEERDRMGRSVRSKSPTTMAKVAAPPPAAAPVAAAAPLPPAPLFPSAQPTSTAAAAAAAATEGLASLSLSTTSPPAAALVFPSAAGTTTTTAISSGLSSIAAPPVMQTITPSTPATGAGGGFTFNFSSTSTGGGGGAAGGGGGLLGQLGVVTPAGSGGQGAPSHLPLHTFGQTSSGFGFGSGAFGGGAATGAGQQTTPAFGGGGGGGFAAYSTGGGGGFGALASSPTQGFFGGQQGSGSSTGGGAFSGTQFTQRRA